MMLGPSYLALPMWLLLLMVVSPDLPDLPVSRLLVLMLPSLALVCPMARLAAGSALPRERNVLV